MNDLTVKLMCVVMRNGVELWLEDARIGNLKKVLKAIQTSKFVEIGEEIINTADIVGVFSADTMDDMRQLKRGAWKCNQGQWHDKEETFCRGHRTFVERSYKPSSSESSPLKEETLSMVREQVKEILKRKI